jgi:dolichyl-phosphate-mannose-protein mannosyltransferase
LWQGKPLERIYLLGNPVIWWGSTVAVLTLVQATIYLGARGLNPSGRWLILGWLMNVLPFMGIGRVMFIYHYLSALVFAILLLAQLVEHAPRSRGMALAIGLMALGLYGYFLPLTYGIPSDRSMFWLPSWR